uniref:Uncharacterized protein n=1 Tax=Amphimedon queenslandica TaxID=400682 RepID=A0A1X7SNQ8_AMPQE
DWKKIPGKYESLKPGIWLNATVIIDYLNIMKQQMKIMVIDSLMLPVMESKGYFAASRFGK